MDMKDETFLKMMGECSPYPPRKMGRKSCDDPMCIMFTSGTTGLGVNCCPDQKFQPNAPLACFSKLMNRWTQGGGHPGSRCGTAGDGWQLGLNF